MHTNLRNHCFTGIIRQSYCSANTAREVLHVRNVTADCALHIENFAMSVFVEQKASIVVKAVSAKIPAVNVGTANHHCKYQLDDSLYFFWFSCNRRN